MAGIAQKISKKTVIREQTGLGVPGSATGQIIRRTSSIFKASRDMYRSEEVVSHHQSTGASYGLRKTDGTLNGHLSAGTYQMPIEGMLEADFAVVSPYAAGIDVTVTGTGTIYTDASAGYLTAGLKVGMVGRWTGFSPTTNNSRNFWITSLTAGVMTGVFLDGNPGADDAAGDSVTFTPVGRFCKPPLTGHLSKYYQVEEWYGDLTDSDLFTDCVVAGLDFDLPASGNANFSSSWVGLSRALSGSQVMTTPTAETTTGIMAAINGRLFVNGASTPITNLKISIKNGAAGTPAEVGSNDSADVSRDIIEVEGSFASMLRDQVLSTLFEDETAVSIIAVLTADETPTSHFMAFTLGKVKLTGDAPDDANAIMRTYPFTAEINRSGGTALAWDDTIITIQDSAAT